MYPTCALVAPRDPGASAPGRCADLADGALVALIEDLETLERDMKRLHIEWEKFFGGVERKPPTELKQRVETLIRRNSGEIRNNTDRFRYQTLTARYNTFNELWSKRLRALEEGRPVGMHGWRAQQAAVAPAPPREAEKPAAPPARPSEFRVRDPGADQAAMRALFDQFLEARKQSGETAPVKYESFQKVVAQQASRILSEKGAQAVDFRLETKDGKVSLKAKPVRP
jgi:hypothetical protein